jgi:hypothetical protein
MSEEITPQIENYDGQEHAQVNKKNRKSDWTKSWPDTHAHVQARAAHIHHTVTVAMGLVN